MQYSLSDSLRFIRHLSASDLETDNLALLHIIAAHLENLRESGDPMAQTMLRDKAETLGEWIELNPEQANDIQLAKEDEEYEELLEERRYLRRQVELIQQWNEQANLNEKTTALERERRNERQESRQQDARNEQAFLLRYEALMQDVAQQAQAVAKLIDTRADDFLQKMKQTHTPEEVEKTRKNLDFVKVVTQEDRTPSPDTLRQYNRTTQENIHRSTQAKADLFETTTRVFKGEKPPESLEQSKIDFVVALEKERAYGYVSKSGEHLLIPPERQTLFANPTYQAMSAELNAALNRYGINGVTDPNFETFRKSPQFQTFLQQGTGQYNMTGQQLMQQVVSLSQLADTTKKKNALAQEIMDGFNQEINSPAPTVGPITAYATYSERLKQEFAPLALEEFALSVTEETLNIKKLPADKYSVVRVQRKDGHYVEMLIPDEDKRYDALDNFAAGYLASALKRDNFSTLNDQDYAKFVQDYLDLYVKESSSITIDRNRGLPPEQVNETNNVFLKLTALNQFAAQHPELAEMISQTKGSLRTELIEALKHNANDKNTAFALQNASDAQFEQIANELIQMKGTSRELYAKVADMSRDYKHNNDKEYNQTSGNYQSIYQSDNDSNNNAINDSVVLPS